MNASGPDVVVLDFGKTNAKVCVVDAAGAIKAQRRSNVPTNEDGAYRSLDVDSLGEWLLDALAELGREYGIQTIIPVAHGACAALIAGDVRALPVMDYEWSGISEIDSDYQAVRPSFAETRSPALGAGLNLGRQLYWLSQYKAEAFANTESILCYPQYWSWFLCGAHTTEVTSLGCHTDLWNPDEHCFSSLVERMGWQDQFPPLHYAWTTAGRLRSTIAQRTGLSRNCAVKTGIHDSNASYIRHLASHEPPFTVISTGTWIVMMAAGSDPAVLDESRDMLANVDVHGAPVPSARFMGGREYAEIIGHSGGNIEPSETGATAIVAEGEMALPSFTDAGGPFAERRGRYTSSPPTEPHERAALATLYCALVCDYALSLLDADRGPLIVEGSFTHNPLFAPLLAQLRQQPVEIADEDTGTVAGAMLLADDAGPRSRAAPTRSVKPVNIPGLAEYRQAWRRCAKHYDVDD